MAELPRFFITNGMSGGEPITITGDALHHLRTVLRLGPGADVLLLDGEGACCRARLITVDRDRATATATACWTAAEQACPLRLLQSLPKGDKFDLVLQKGTELGVTAFQPLLSRLTQARADGTRRTRWLRIVSEAARQCRRPRLPRLEPLCSLPEALAQVVEPLRLVLWEESARPLREVLPATPPAGIAVLVGPEGGFSGDEVAGIETAGFVPVHLGPRILRTETAGLAASAVLQYLYGDWRHPPQHDRPGSS